MNLDTNVGHIGPFWWVNQFHVTANIYVGDRSTGAITIDVPGSFGIASGGHLRVLCGNRIYDGAPWR